VGTIRDRVLINALLGQMKRYFKSPKDSTGFREDAVGSPPHTTDRAPGIIEPPLSQARVAHQNSPKTLLDHDFGVCNSLIPLVLKWAKIGSHVVSVDPAREIALRASNSEV
jgi:hypothetical protein